MTGNRAATPHARLVLSAALLLAAAGAVAWFLMPRQEDPTFPARFSLLTVVFPGAEAETVERLILDPLEEELAQVEEVRHVTSTARTGVAISEVELRQDIYETSKAWDQVREAIERARRDFPEDARRPKLQDNLVQQESMVIAVTGSTDYLKLREGAQKLKERLARVEGVARVNLIADPEQQITLEYDSAAARRLGVNQRLLAQQLRQRNVTIPGGTIRLGDTRANLRPQADFGSIDELRTTPISLPSGGTVVLEDVTEVRRGPKEPPATRMRHNGQMAVAVGVVPQFERHLVQVGRRVRAELDELRADMEPLQLHEVTFQPDYVEDRLDGLGMSLLMSVIIVAGVLFLAMGRRPALVVASMVPVVTLGALALYWFGGGVLHQMSIAAFVIALGMLVDNAIVMVEQIQSQMDRGTPALRAARSAVRQLGIPLAAATGTTTAAFLPMWLASGATADFTRALPVVIVLTLALSLAAAVVVTPTVCAMWLRRERTSGSRDLATRIAFRIGSIGVHRHRAVLAGAAVVMAAVGGMAVFVDQQFFPAADRNQFVVELRMPEGSHLERVNEASRKVERMLSSHGDVTDVASFVGRSVPRFYYNVPLEPHAPQLAHVLVTTRDKSVNTQVMSEVRDFLGRELPEAQGVVRRLQQGPAMAAPVEVRLYGPDEALGKASDRVLRELKKVPGAVDVRQDLDFGTPTVRLDILDAAAGRHGLARSDVAVALLGQTRGIPVGQYRGGDETVPIVLRSSRGEDTSVNSLTTLGVSRKDGSLVPLGQVAKPTVEWRPAVVRHRDGKRVTRVMAQLEPGVPFGRVLAGLQKRLDGVELPKDVELELGGAAEGSGQANRSLMRALPIGLLLMLLCLLWEFNSFRRVAIVLTTVPAAAVGIVPGLLIGDQPFGFMSLLGVIALSGIVVNNAIVLLDVVERERKSGRSVSEALSTAVRIRTRPILLTTTTTVGGLLPLALSDSSLWPPLAWAMITGLVGSSLLTLLVVPALYRVLFRERTTRSQVEDEVDDDDTMVQSYEPPMGQPGAVRPLQ
jgi:multidrug efflux pump subunit AcrB